MFGLLNRSESCAGGRPARPPCTPRPPLLRAISRHPPHTVLHSLTRQPRRWPADAGYPATLLIYSFGQQRRHNSHPLRHNNATPSATTAPPPAATTAPPPPPQQRHNSLHNSATSAAAAFMEREYLWCNSVFMVTDGSGIKSLASVYIDSGAPVVGNGRQLPNKIFRHKQSISWIK